MKTKIAVVLILAIIALTTISYSYASMNGGAQANSCCECDCAVDFIKVTTCDNEKEKEVGDVSAQITCDGSTIEVCIENSYPCYEAYIDFTLKNTGDKPIHIDEVCVEEYDKTALEISITNIACTTLCPCNSLTGSLTVHTLQPAKECHTYTLKIKIKISCDTQKHPRTIGFWKNQFETALCKNGKPQVPAATLEQYLNQISSQSHVFSFTGTRKQKFQQALNILSPPRHSSMEAKLKAQLLALWLNYMAGWTAGYKLKGMTAYQIIQGSESALINHATSQYEYWKNLCDDFNNLK